MKTALIALVVGLFSVSTMVYANTSHPTKVAGKHEKKKGKKEEKKEEKKDEAAAPSTEQKPAEGAPAQGN